MKWFCGVLLAMLVTDVQAQWEKSASGCKVQLPDTVGNGFFTWKGECIDGKASGAGSVFGSGFRLEGEFQEGRPMEAQGVRIATDAQGKLELVEIRYTRGQRVERPYPDIPGGRRIATTPLTGHWRADYRNGNCREFIEFRTNNGSTEYHRAHETHNVVRLFELPGNPGWLALARTINSFETFQEKGDCPGEDLRAFMTRIVYLKTSGAQTQFCTSPSLESCFATATRLTPDAWLGERREVRPVRVLIMSANKARGASSSGVPPASPTQPLPAADARESIEIIFDRNKGALHALYARALRDNPRLQGKFVARMTIAESGETTNCSVVSSELGDPVLEQKLCARLKVIRFRAMDKPLTITKPIDFFPAR